MVMILTEADRFSLHSPTWRLDGQVVVLHKRPVTSWELGGPLWV